jgi:oxalate decarboxylase
MPVRHVASLTGRAAAFASADGSIAKLSPDDLPQLERLSIRRLLLAPVGVREPHWHANAAELGYCVRGRLLVSILENGSAASLFTVDPGQMFFVPSGALHHLENVGEDEAEVVLALTHERPQDFGLSASFGAMSDAVLGNTFDLDASAFAPLTRSTTPTEIGRRTGPAQVPASARRVDPHRFDVEAAPAVIDVDNAGSARLARAQFWPILDGVSMYSLTITEDGMREPHWHPATAELGYVMQGHARMTILSPDGTADTYELQAGDVYFVPRAYPHHIENLGGPDLRFLIFFDQVTPGDIGYRGSATAVPRPALEATFGTAGAALPELPFTPVDPLIVGRVNPVDR